MKAISSFSLHQYINESNLMHISDIYHVYSRYIPDISHYSLYHHITLKDGRIILQKNRSVHCTYSSKQCMYSNGWKPGFIQKTYSRYIPGIFPAYPLENTWYIPGKTFLGIPDVKYDKLYASDMISLICNRDSLQFRRMSKTYMQNMHNI